MKKSLICVLYALMAAVIVVCDQLTKKWAIVTLKGKESLKLIDGVFELKYLENTGAAFSSFTGKQGFLIVLTFIILILCIIEFIRIPADKKYFWLRLSFSFIIAGAIGNMIDRVFQGYVVDFFYFSLIDFPVFNVADIFVTVAIPILIITLCFYYKDEDIDFLLKIKKK